MNLSLFFVQRIIIGKTSFAKVPSQLKDRVRELLIESNFENFIDE